MGRFWAGKWEITVNWKELFYQTNLVCGIRCAYSSGVAVISLRGGENGCWNILFITVKWLLVLAYILLFDDVKISQTRYEWTFFYFSNIHRYLAARACTCRPLFMGGHASFCDGRRMTGRLTADQPPSARQPSIHGCDGRPPPGRLDNQPSGNQTFLWSPGFRLFSMYSMHCLGFCHIAYLHTNMINAQGWAHDTYIVRCVARLKLNTILTYFFRHATHSGHTYIPFFSSHEIC